MEDQRRGEEASPERMEIILQEGDRLLRQALGESYTLQGREQRFGRLFKGVLESEQDGLGYLLALHTVLFDARLLSAGVVERHEKLTRNPALRGLLRSACLSLAREIYMDMVSLGRPPHEDRDMEV